MGKYGESVKISCFTLLWFSKQFKQIELTSKSIYIIVGLFTSSRDNISFNHEQFLKKSQAVALVVLKCSKVYLPHLTQKTIYFFYFFYIYIYIYILACQQENKFTFSQQHFHFIMGSTS